MAKKIDKDLFDRLVKRQIAVGRYAERQAYEIIKLLNRADKELLAKIIDRGESDSFTGRRLEALLKETRSMVDKSYRELFDATKGEMVQFAPHAGEFAASTLSMSLPAAWSPVAISDEQLVAIVDKAPISIGRDKKLLLEEVFSSMAAGKEEMIRGALRLGMVQGETVDQMVRRLKGTRAAQYRDGLLEGSRRSMANMVRSVVQHTNNVAAQALYSKNSDVLNGMIDVATLDSRTCMECAKKSGMKIAFGELGPIWHISCRCFTAPDVKSWAELGFDLPEFGKFDRAAKGGPVDADISFHDWLKGQDGKTQVELLGPARARLFADGKVHLDKFTDASGNLYTLSDLSISGQKVKPAIVGDAIAPTKSEMKIKYWGPNNMMVSVDVQFIPRNGQREFTIMDDGTPVLYADPIFLQNKDILKSHILPRVIDDYLSPLAPDEYIRVSKNKDDYNHVKEGTHRGSINHANGEAEYGLSVAKAPEFSAKYAYYVKGTYIADGTDGEPVIDVKTAKVNGKLWKYEDLHDDYTARMKEKAAALGLSKDALRALRTSRNIIF